MRHDGTGLDSTRLDSTRHHAMRHYKTRFLIKHEIKKEEVMNFNAWIKKIEEDGKFKFLKEEK
jgi:hypothetical protein